jgi:calcium/calmodulin-dependent protein kinase I
VHRDLKPENILYKTRDESSPIVIADFGIAKHLDSADEEVTSMAGSFGYAAPEVLLGKPHGLKVDMWSIGVITYTLLCGYSPFRSDDKNELIRETTKGKVTFHERFWKHVSETARDFIRRLLVVDPKDRMSAAEALNHPWMKGSDGEDYDLSANIRENFNPRKKWKDAFRVIQASNKFKMAAAGAAHQAKPEPLDTDSSESEGFRTAESDEDTKVQGAGTARKAGGGGGLAGLVGQAKAKAAADTGLEASVQSLKVELCRVCRIVSPHSICLLEPLAC